MVDQNNQSSGNKQAAEKTKKKPTPAVEGMQPFFQPPAELATSTALLQRVKADPRAMSPENMATVQQAVGNRVAHSLIARTVQGGDPGERRSSTDNKGDQGLSTAQQPKHASPAVRRQAPDGGGMDVSSEVEETIEEKRGGGEALPHSTRQSMEGSFGADFSDVKVHHDDQAHTLNQSLSARAFTTGQDIFFAEGEYNPDTSEGERLMAHELTHVVQQTGHQVQPKLMVGEADDVYEQEADAVADEVMRMSDRQAQPKTGVAGATEETIQRQDAASDKDEKKEMTEEEANELKEKTVKEQKSKNEGKLGAEPAKADKGEGGGSGGEAKPAEDDQKAAKAEPDYEEMEEEPDLEENVTDHLDYTEFNWDTTGQTFLPNWDLEMGWSDIFAGGDPYGNLFNEVEPTEPPELDKGKILGDAFAQGAVSGLTDGAVSLATGTIMELATQKVPYAGGFIAMAEIAYNPEAWFESNVMGIGKKAEAMASGFVDAFSGEGSGFYKAARFFDGLIGLLEMVNSVISLVNTILQIFAAVAFACSFIPIVGAAFAPIPPALMPVINALSAIGPIINASIMIFLRPLAMILYAIDIAWYESDPEKLMQRQAALTGHVKGFVSEGVKTAGGAAKNKAKAKYKTWKDQRAQRNQEAAGISDEARSPTPASPEQKPKFYNVVGRLRGVGRKYQEDRAAPEHEQPDATGGIFVSIIKDSLGGKGLEDLAGAGVTGGISFTDPKKMKDVKAYDASDEFEFSKGLGVAQWYGKTEAKSKEEQQKEYKDKWMERYKEKEEESGAGESEEQAGMQEELGGEDFEPTEEQEKLIREKFDGIAGALPEPPENIPGIVEGAALGLAYIYGERQTLQMEETAAKDLTEFGMNEIKAFEGGKQITQANVETTGAHKDYMDKKLEAQAGLEKKGQEGQGKAEGGQSKGGLMESMLAPFIDVIISNMSDAQEEGATDEAGPDPGEAQEGMADQTKASEDAGKTTEKAAGTAQQWQADTEKAKGQAETSEEELLEFEDFLTEQQDEIGEGLDILDETQEEIQAGYDIMDEEEERLLQDREEAITETSQWAEEHYTTREEMFAELRELLGAGTDEEIETSEEELVTP